VLGAIRQLLSQSATSIAEGWGSILTALKPEYIGEDFSIAFRCIQIVANHLLFRLPDPNPSQFLQLIFEDAEQFAGSSLSLSAFEPLWNIVPICKSVHLWEKTLGGTARLIRSPRNDVAHCTVDTFFGLIVSNAEAVPRVIFGYVANDVFLPPIDSLANGTDDGALVQQPAFHGLAHCGRNLWDYFRDVDSVNRAIWSTLILGYDQFMKRCEKRESLIAAFQFYEEVFLGMDPSAELLVELFSILDRLAGFLVPREDAKRQEAPPPERDGTSPALRVRPGGDGIHRYRPDQAARSRSYANGRVDSLNITARSNTLRWALSKFQAADPFPRIDHDSGPAHMMIKTKVKTGVYSFLRSRFNLRSFLWNAPRSCSTESSVASNEVKGRRTDGPKGKSFFLGFGGAWIIGIGSEAPFGRSSGASNGLRSSEKARLAIPNSVVAKEFTGESYSGMLIVECMTPSAQSNEEATAGLYTGEVNSSASARWSSHPGPNIHRKGNRRAGKFPGFEQLQSPSS
jgi:hypothetical protein